MTRHTVGRFEDLPEGDGMGVKVDGIEIAVFNVDGALYAMQNACIHKRGPLYEGELNREHCSVYCPWHYWEFDLKTGKYAVNGKKQMRTFEAGVTDGEIWVEL